MEKLQEVSNVGNALLYVRTNVTHPYGIIRIAKIKMHVLFVLSVHVCRVVVSTTAKKGCRTSGQEARRSALLETSVFAKYRSFSLNLPNFAFGRYV